MTKELRALALGLLLALLLAGCESGRSVKPTYPKFEYRNSTYNMDPFNREIPVEDGYVLDEGRSYDIEETDDGYDITFHMVTAKEETT